VRCYLWSHGLVPAMNRLRLTLAIALLFSSTAHAQLASQLNGIFGQGVAIGKAADFASPFAYALYADGSLAVVDYGRYDVTRLSADGRVMWRSGRKGSGPGEFQLPVRVVVLQDQSALIFDPGKVGMSHIDASGAYLEEVVSDIKLRIDQMLALSNGQVVILGSTDDPRGKGAAVHVLTDRLKHVRSFGRLPEMKDPRVLTSFGAGGMTLAADGLILHTRFYPYEISKYTADGTEQFRLRVSLPVATPEEFVRIDVAEGRVTRTVNPGLLRPIPAKDLGTGPLLGGRSRGKSITLDLISADGMITSSSAMPPGWEYLVAIDRPRRRFWIAGESDDIPVLWRVPFGPTMPPD